MEGKLNILKYLYMEYNMRIAGSYNGSTADSESAYLGSSPSPAARHKTAPCLTRSKSRIEPQPDTEGDTVRYPSRMVSVH